MNAPTKITLHRPSFQGDHVIKISLAPIPGTTDAKPKTYGKTPLEAYQESRIPKPGAFDKIGATTEEKRAAIAAQILLAALDVPKSSMQIAGEIGEEQSRVAKALSVLELRGIVCRIKRSQHAALWCKPGTVFDGRTILAEVRHMSRKEYAQTMREKMEKRLAAIVALIREGVDMSPDIAARMGKSASSTDEDLRTLRTWGRVRSEWRQRDGKRRMVYEVAE